MKKFCLFLICFVSTIISSICSYADEVPIRGAFREDTMPDTTLIVIGAGVAVVIISVLSIAAIKKISKSKKVDSESV